MKKWVKWTYDGKRIFYNHNISPFNVLLMDMEQTEKNIPKAAVAKKNPRQINNPSRTINLAGKSHIRQLKGEQRWTQCSLFAMKNSHFFLFVHKLNYWCALKTIVFFYKNKIKFDWILLIYFIKWHLRFIEKISFETWWLIKSHQLARRFWLSKSNVEFVLFDVDFVACDEYFFENMKLLFLMNFQSIFIYF